jgi:alpha-glucosidase
MNKSYHELLFKEQVKSLYPKKKQKIIQISFIVLIITLLTFHSTISAQTLKSPNGKVMLHFELKKIGSEKDCPVYNVTYGGHPVLTDSRLGLCERSLSLTNEFRVIGIKTSTYNSTWKPVLGERETTPDHYNQLVIELRSTKTAEATQRMTLTFRAYNEGVAFNYSLPKENGKMIEIIGEQTQFSFSADHAAWAVYRAQGDYTKSQTNISKIAPGAERPLTVRVEDHLYAAITEARLVDYARMKLRHSDDSDNTMEVILDAEPGRNHSLVNGIVTGKTTFITPWRVIMVADSPGELLEQNYLVMNLNDPCALTDVSWIKPGKVIRESSLTTVGGKACVDFAISHGLQYIEFDAGWYGREEDPASDATDVHLDPRRNPDPTSLNLREVIDYGNTKGIGTILYVNHLAMEKQLDEILPLYEKWGVKGVKYGFVNVGSQHWTAWLHEAIRKAAAHHLLVDIHDEFRNTGYQRTYPNLVTCEGIGGNEEFPTPVHNATLPFTRFLTGPADYTYCWTDKRLKVTKAHQMALSTIFFSPWQFLYWYDKPGNVPDEPALDYWKHLPTTWDETSVLQGEIGKRAVVARRKGDEWFMGAIAPVDGKFMITFNFLPAKTKYMAKIYSDTPDAKGVKIEEKVVDRKSTLDADLLPNGGLAVQLIPLKR